LKTVCNENEEEEGSNSATLAPYINIKGIYALVVVVTINKSFLKW